MYRSSTQEAAKSDSEFFSSVTWWMQVNLNERKTGEEQVSEGLCVLVFMFMRNLELKIFLAIVSPSQARPGFARVTEKGKKTKTNTKSKPKQNTQQSL